MELPDILHRIARGRHGADDLDRDTARRAMHRLLDEEADPVQLGAFLVAQRMKGESPAELAGFTEAARGRMPERWRAGEARLQAVDLPCYAGKRRAVHLHLIAAWRLRAHGVRTVVHGVGSIEGRRTAWPLLEKLGVRQAGNRDLALAILERDGIVYLDLSEFCPDLSRLLGLRSRIGIRHFGHTVARLMNPLNCAAQLNGVFHTPYADRMAEANRLLGQAASLVFTGAEGEPELLVSRQKRIVLQKGRGLLEVRAPELEAGPYPRQPKDCLDELEGDMLRILGGRPDARERVALARMESALQWAAAGFPEAAMPEGWSLHPVAGEGSG